MRPRRGGNKKDSGTNGSGTNSPGARSRKQRSVSVSEPDDPQYLFQELAIDPPLAEFRRIFEKKARSFEMDQDTEKLEPYQQAFELGVMMIERHLGEPYSSSSKGSSSSDGPARPATEDEFEFEEIEEEGDQ